ncbi:glutathione S-transferase 2-like isoform X2 [Ananas comosus]|uniref:Glutathione S-transferase 2-like isoform X2 n=1 Tax=Ananas comosus TaxID=4615 RepID=A0A6P5GVZ7_ANACO|nr:glutathione S-transferase 2-like isoform X2 [Ananas comosus]
MKGLDYEYKAVNLLKGEQSNPEFEKINPVKYVPALVDGDVVVADLFAIILYLEDKYPQNPLLPQDLKKKALNLQIASVVSSGIRPFQNLLVLQYIKENLGAEKKLPWVQLHINKGFTGKDEWCNFYKVLVFDDS